MSKITVKERLRRVGKFNAELLKLVGVSCEAVAAASAAVAVVDSTAACMQVAANNKGHKVLGVKPNTYTYTEGHLWNKETHTVGVVKTPLQFHVYEMPTNKEGK